MIFDHHPWLLRLTLVRMLQSKNKVLNSHAPPLKSQTSLLHQMCLPATLSLNRVKVLKTNSLLNIETMNRSFQFNQVQLPKAGSLSNMETSNKGFQFMRHLHPKTTLQPITLGGQPFRKVMVPRITIPQLNPLTTSNSRSSCRKCRPEKQIYSR
jgi:hypothetical protein